MENNKDKEINFKRNIKEYFQIVKKRKGIIFGLIFSIIFLELAALSEKYLFKVIIDGGTNYTSNLIQLDSLIKILIIVGIVFISILIFRSLIRWLTVHLINKLDFEAVQDLKLKYFNHILSLSHSFHSSHKTGSLISRLGRGASAIERLTDVFLFQMVPIVVQFIAVSISFAIFDIHSTITLAVMVVCFIGISLYIQNKQKKAHIEMTNSEDFEKGFVSNIFTNIETIKYFGKEKYIGREFFKVSENTKKKNYLYGNYFRSFEAIQRLILGLGTFFIIYFPLTSFLEGNLSMGTLAFIYSAYLSIIGPLFGFVWGIRGYYRGMGDLQSLLDYKEIKNDIEDKSYAKKAKIRKGEVEFRNVSFSYGRKKAFSLDNFNLKIKPCEKIALVGHSGCGKTTLVKLIYRLYDTKKGNIFIDGENIKNFRQESLRGEMSIVPQEAILFDDTLYNNIKFSNPRAKKEDVLKAIKFARLDKFIENLPDKENTIVGERGIKLSGGERQRVSIARAILANKKILILDEATSALDSETEYAIQQDLKKLLVGRTSIIIAHRLSTIMNANRIIVMKNGKIIEEGTHNELIQKNGEYTKLWKLQKGGYLKE